jgi:solute:Na+ symporter, SSS family
MMWMALPSLEIAMPGLLPNPLHANMTIVVGTLTIFLVGMAASLVWGEPRPNSENVE